MASDEAPRRRPPDQTIASPVPDHAAVVRSMLFVASDEPSEIERSPRRCRDRTAVSRNVLCVASDEAPPEIISVAAARPERVGAEKKKNFRRVVS